MAFNTYATLQTTIANWLSRQDLTAQIPDFINLLEVQAERKLRTRHMIKRCYATVTDQYIALPTDYLEIRNVQLNSYPVQQLEYVTMGYLDEVRTRYPAADRPLYYSIVGNTIELAPVPDASYEIEIVYYAKIPKLSNQVTTNWLLDEWPDLYLYGSLMNAEPYLKNDERISTWGSAVAGIFEDIKTADDRATAAGSPLKMRIKPYGR